MRWKAEVIENATGVRTVVRSVSPDTFRSWVLFNEAYASHGKAREKWSVILRPVRGEAETPDND